MTHPALVSREPATCIHTLNGFREKINPWVDLAKEGEGFYQQNFKSMPTYFMTSVKM